MAMAESVRTAMRANRRFVQWMVSVYCLLTFLGAAGVGPGGVASGVGALRILGLHAVADELSSTSDRLREVADSDGASLLLALWLVAALVLIAYEYWKGDPARRPCSSVLTLALTVSMWIDFEVPYLGTVLWPIAAFALVVSLVAQFVFRVSAVRVIVRPVLSGPIVDLVLWAVYAVIGPLLWLARQDK